MARLENAAAVARRVVEHVGGRFSAELGIDVDAGDDQVERWFLAATLFGNPIQTAVAERTFHVFRAAGIDRVAQTQDLPSKQLVALLDEGGYARYDFRTADRLERLATFLREHYLGSVGQIGRTFLEPSAVEAALDALPGWGPVTVTVFLRELRGVWAGANPKLDDRTVEAMRHVRLVGGGRADATALAGLARAAGLDRRDLEAGLVRLSLTHRSSLNSCVGGAKCLLLS